MATAQDPTILFALEAVVLAVANYVNSFQHIRGAVFNSENQLDDDFRRIIEVNTAEGREDKINMQTLPYMVMSLDSMGDFIENVPYSGKFKALVRPSPDVSTWTSTIYRLIQAVVNARIYTTSYMDALRFVERLYVYEDTMFTTQYTVPHITGDIVHKVQIRLDSPTISKVSGLESKGQIFKVGFNIDLKLPVLGDKSDVRIVRQANLKVYNWVNEDINNPLARPGLDALLLESTET